MMLLPPILTGRGLRRKRVQAGWSQLALSIRSRVSRWRLRLAEYGVVQLREPELRRIQRVLAQPPPRRARLRKGGKPSPRQTNAAQPARAAPEETPTE